MTDTLFDEGAILAESIRSCRRCELRNECSAPVPFSGPYPSDLAIVGEAPGPQEDAGGEPFIGPAGQLIRELLGDIGVSAERTFICNTAACYPGPTIKTPSLEHIVACRINKLAQLDLANPKWVLLLGGTALRGFRDGIPISKGRARPFKPVGADYVCFATYHPAYALRAPLAKEEIRGDLERFRRLMDAGPDRWGEFAPDHCVFCTNYVSWVDADGFGMCTTHEPPQATARREFVQSEYEAACRRLEGHA